jgi:hypothetical protein
MLTNDWDRKSLSVLAILTGVCAALYSAVLTATVARSMPYFDQWVFVVLDYFSYLDGHYSWRGLFQQHNEHRILTTRLILWADALLFGMKGWFPIVINFGCLAWIGAIVTSLLADRDAWQRAGFFAISLGLLWSLCQYENLTWQFQVVFAVSHLITLCCLFALAKSDRSRSWLAYALIGDALAVFSSGGGPFLIFPAIALFVWRRMFNRSTLIFVAFHLAMTALYFIDYHWSNRLHAVAPMTAGLEVMEFLGWPFARSEYIVFFGCAGFALFAGLVALLTINAFRQKENDRQIAVILSLASYIVLEAVIVAFTRTAISPRYGTAALIFWAAILGCLWRLARTLPFLPLTRAIVALAAVAVIIYSDETAWSNTMRDHAAFLDKVVAAVKKDQYPPDMMQQLMPLPWITDAVKRLKQLRVGPFSPGD